MSKSPLSSKTSLLAMMLSLGLIGGTNAKQERTGKNPRFLPNDKRHSRSRYTPAGPNCNVQPNVIKSHRNQSGV